MKLLHELKKINKMCADYINLGLYWESGDVIRKPWKCVG